MICCNSSSQAFLKKVADRFPVYVIPKRELDLYILNFSFHFLFTSNSIYHLLVLLSNLNTTSLFFFMSRENKRGIGIVVSKLLPLLYSFLRNSILIFYLS